MRFYNKERKSLRTNTCYISLNIFWTALRHITINKGDCSRGENLNFCVRENFLTVWDPKRTYSLALSFQFIHSIMSNSLQHHGLQHARLPCPSPPPRACSNSCPLTWWCHPTISSSVVAFFSCLQSFPASGSFPRSQFFASGGQSTGASASASVFPMNIQGWFPLGWTGLISLQSKDSQESSPTPQFKSINSPALSFLCSSTYIHTWLLEKPYLWLDGPLLAK